MTSKVIFATNTREYHRVHNYVSGAIRGFWETTRMFLVAFINKASPISLNLNTPILQ